MLASAAPRTRHVWSRAGSVRARTTAGAALTVALALGAVLVTELQRRALTENIDSSLERRADDLAALLAEGPLPSLLGGAGAGGGDETLSQILDAGGRVVSASANIEGAPPIAEGFVPARGRVLRTAHELAVGDDPFRVLAQRLERGDGVYTLYVAESLDAVGDSTEALGRIFVIAVPLMVSLVAVVTWFFVGRALSPVEAIRAEVAGISGGNLQRRVPEPRTNDEIARLATTMNEMLGRLEAAYERERQFVADASHELRSPLTSIRTQIEVDLAHPEGANAQDTAHAVLEETRRLERLVDDLLRLAREDGVATTRMVPVDFDDIVLREATRARAGNQLQIDTTHVSGAQLLGDPDQLTRVVRNLLDNAVRFARSRVTLSLGEQAAALVLTIEDDGPGIPREHHERIFDRLLRLDAARSRSAGGSGLGLAITREIVERHGGVIAVDAGFTQGARFVLRVPSSSATNARAASS